MWIDGYTGGHQNLIGFLSLVACVINILVKAVLGVMLYKQYSDTKTLESENKNNYY